jgi:YYY domain-containing protein
LAALLGVVFVVLLSNFEGPLEIAHWKGLGSQGLWTWLDIADLDRPPPDLDNSQLADRLTRPSWWWWRASRVIFDYDVRDWPNRYNKAADPAPQRRENIDEFPFFSFLLGDMHPHVLALPFVMLALTVSLTLFHIGRTTSQTNLADRQWFDGIPKAHLLLFALIFGALGFLNTWDFPIQWIVGVTAYGVGRLANLRMESRNSESSPIAIDDPAAPMMRSVNQRQDLRHQLRSILYMALTLGLGGLLLYVPFYLSFQSQAGGLLVHVHSSTRLSQFFVMFGPLLVILGLFLAYGLRFTVKRHRLALRKGLWIAAILLSVTLGILVITSIVVWVSPSVRTLVAPGLSGEEPASIALRYLAMRLSAPWVTLLLIAMIGVASALLFTKSFSATAQFSLLLIIAGAAMTLTPEYVYLKDVFGVRLNTIFKFYFQAWVLWSVAAAGAVYVLLFGQERLESSGRRVFLSILTLVIGLGLIYPVLSISDRIQEFPEAPTLDGTAYLASEQPSDYAAVQWLNDHVDGTPVILETPGGAYQYEGRVSALTGLPTLLGWAGHEHQWRGNTIEQSKRSPVIEELCSTNDAQRTLTLLDEYDITYVYVGPLERTKCSVNGLAKFDRLMEIVYDRDGVKIYKRRDVTGSRIGE